MYSTNQAAIEARARRAARKVGLIARKSRWRAGTIDNYGDFMLIEPSGNYPVAGYRYDMTAEESPGSAGGPRGRSSNRALPSTSCSPIRWRLGRRSRCRAGRP